MSLECCAAFKVAALRYTRVESKVCHQLFAMRETAHIAHRRHYSVESDEINAAQTRQAQQRFLGRDFLSHVTAQQVRRARAATKLLCNCCSNMVRAGVHSRRASSRVMALG